MEEIGADSSQIKNFIYSLRQGLPADQALAPLSIPAIYKNLCTFNLENYKQVNSRSSCGLFNWSRGYYSCYV